MALLKGDTIFFTANITPSFIFEDMKIHTCRYNDSSDILKGGFGRW